MFGIRRPFKKPLSVRGSEITFYEFLGEVGRASGVILFSDLRIWRWVGVGWVEVKFLKKYDAFLFL
jgi:hypothetical protein